MPTQDSMNRAERLLSLERLIMTQPGRRFRTKELADVFNVSEDTMTRDLKELSRSGRVPLISNGTTAGFTWELDPEFQQARPD